MIKSIDGTGGSRDYRNGVLFTDQDKVRTYWIYQFRRYLRDQFDSGVSRSDAFPSALAICEKEMEDRPPICTEEPTYFKAMSLSLSVQARRDWRRWEQPGAE